MPRTPLEPFLLLKQLQICFAEKIRSQKSVEIMLPSPLFTISRYATDRYHALPTILLYHTLPAIPCIAYYTIHCLLYHTLPAIPYIGYYTIHYLLYHTLATIPYIASTIPYIAYYTMHCLLYHTLPTIPYIAYYTIYCLH